MFLAVVGRAGVVGISVPGRLKREEAARAALAAEVAAFGPRFEQFKGAVRDVDRQLVVHRLSRGRPRPPRAGSRSRAASTSSTSRATAAGKGTRDQSARSSTRRRSCTRRRSSRSRIDDKRATFSLPAVPPGVAQPFDVTLPDVAPAAAQKAFFALESSTINFASSTTRKRSRRRTSRHRQAAEIAPPTARRRGRPCRRSC